jgi:hypothetical protein
MRWTRRRRRATDRCFQVAFRRTLRSCCNSLTCRS